MKGDIIVGFFGRRLDQKSCDAYARQAQNWWNQVSQGYLNMTAIGVAMDEDFHDLPVPAPYFGLNGMREMWSRLDYDFTPDYWHMLGGYFPGQCGQALLRGRVGRTNTDMGCGVDTMLHEKGHNFGLGHGNIWYPKTETTKEYADKNVIMGSGKRVWSLNAAQAYYLGWYDPLEVNMIKATTRFNCVPWDLPARNRFNDEHAFNIIGGTQIPGVQGRVFICNNMTKGYPYKLENQGVFIVSAYGSSNRVDGMLTEGESFKITNGPEIFVHSIDENDVADVAVVWNDDPMPDREIPVKDLRAFPTDDLKFVEPKHSGAYYNPNMVGQGFDLYCGNNKTILYWYTFEQFKDWPRVETRPVWFIADVTNGIGELRSYNGDPRNPTIEGLVRVGMENGNLVVDYDTQDWGRGHMNCQRIAKLASPKDGIYYDPKKDGKGCTLRFDFENNRMYGWWYRYENNNIPVWYYLDGKKDLTGVYPLTVYKAKGTFNKFNYGEEFLLDETRDVFFNPLTNELKGFGETLNLVKLGT
jgi:hypothetical protein